MLYIYNVNTITIIVGIWANFFFHLNVHFKLRFSLDVNYNLSDEMLIEIMKTAKSLSDVGATAAEVIHLTRCIVEFKADSKVNVGYMIHGLIERSVFEFTKKQIASE